MDAEALIDALDLSPHPEGGWYRETWRASAGNGERLVGTAIYYLLKSGERSHWHRVDAAEIWHWYRGAPLALRLSSDSATTDTVTLGPDIAAGEHPQVIVPAGFWQSAETRGAFTLVGCTVSPGFEFTGFEMAPPEWEPGRTEAWGEA